ncbi:MAG: hypothetical protein LC725_05305 [Lentisphaerae bacterium]|nr:hypothetical protein [Lentisphaerota bacterium]
MNLSPKNYEVLRTLGVQRLLDCHLEGALPDDLQELLRHTTVFYPVAHNAPDQQTRTAVMLDAHDDLIRADPSNLMKFKDVVDLLRRERTGGGDPEKE